MSTASQPSTIIDRLHRLSYAQYRAMADAEILGMGDRIELIEGLMIRKFPKSNLHILGSGLAQDVLIFKLPDRWHVSMQNPIGFASSASELEPDAMIVRGHPRDYASRPVEGGDVALVVEVADESLSFDQTVKKTIYAGGLIPSYWIVNIPANRIEAYSDPTGTDYRRRVDLGLEDTIPLILDGREVAQIAVRDLLP